MANIDPLAGPWEIHPCGTVLDICLLAEPGAKGVAVVASVFNGPRCAELIREAPELLAICEEFVRRVDAGEIRSKRTYARMKAAIARVRGEAEFIGTNQ